MIPEVPVCLSMAIIAYQDFRFRLVDDWAFLPAILFIPLAYILTPWALFPALFKAAVLGLLGILVYKLGLTAQADGFTLPLLGLSTGFMSPLPAMVGAGAVAGVHIAYMLIKHGLRGLTRVMSVEEALKNDKWIPKMVEMDGKVVELPMPPEKAWEKLKEFELTGARVHVSFGTPLAGYLALGYLAYFLLRILLPYGLEL